LTFDISNHQNFVLHHQIFTLSNPDYSMTFATTFARDMFQVVRIE